MLQHRAAIWILTTKSTMFRFYIIYLYISQTKIKFINQQDDHTKSTVKAINIRTHQDDISS